MGLSRILGVLKRRWYVLVIGLLLSAGLGLLGVQDFIPVCSPRARFCCCHQEQLLDAGGRNPFCISMA